MRKLGVVFGYSREKNISTEFHLCRFVPTQTIDWSVR